MYTTNNNRDDNFLSDTQDFSREHNNMNTGFKRNFDWSDSSKDDSNLSANRDSHNFDLGYNDNHVKDYSGNSGFYHNESANYSGNDSFLKEISKQSQQNLTAFLMSGLESLFRNVSKYIDPRRVLNENRYKLLESLLNQEKKLVDVLELVDKYETKYKTAESIMKFTDLILSRAYEDFNLSKKFEDNPYDNLKLLLRNNGDLMGKQEYWTKAFENQNEILLMVLRHNVKFLDRSQDYENFLEKSLKESIKDFVATEKLNINRKDLFNFPKIAELYEQKLEQKLNNIDKNNSMHKYNNTDERDAIVEQLRMINDLKKFNYFRNLNESIHGRMEGSCDIIMELLNKHPRKNTAYIKSSFEKNNKVKVVSINLIKNATYNLLYDDIVKKYDKELIHKIVGQSKQKFTKLEKTPREWSMSK